MKIAHTFLAVCLFAGIGAGAQNASKTLMQNLPGTEYAILHANIKAAGLGNTLSGKGPFTLFAPTDAAFNKSPTVSVEKPGKAVDKSNLQELITYHIVAGKMDKAAIASAIKSGGGKATLTTLQGGKLTLTMKGDELIVTDGRGGSNTIVNPDVPQSNGVLHGISTILNRK